MYETDQNQCRCNIKGFTVYLVGELIILSALSVYFNDEINKDIFEVESELFYIFLALWLLL